MYGFLVKSFVYWLLFRQRQKKKKQNKQRKESSEFGRASVRGFK